MEKAERSVKVIPTTENKEMQIEYNGIQFKDWLKLISSPLKIIVVQTPGDYLKHYNSEAIAGNVANSGKTNKSIC